MVNSYREEMNTDYEKSVNMRDIGFMIENKEKVYYIGSLKLGTEYDVVKFMIGKGFSSSKAHKVIDKTKEIKM